MIQISAESQRKKKKSEHRFESRRVCVNRKQLLKVRFVAHQIDVILFCVSGQKYAARLLGSLHTLFHNIKLFFELISDVESHQCDSTGTLLFSDSHWGDTTCIKVLPQKKKNPCAHGGNYWILSALNSWWMLDGILLLITESLRPVM